MALARFASLHKLIFSTTLSSEGFVCSVCLHLATNMQWSITTNISQADHRPSILSKSATHQFDWTLNYARIDCVHGTKSMDSFSPVEITFHATNNKKQQKQWMEFEIRLRRFVHWINFQLKYDFFISDRLSHKRTTLFMNRHEGISTEKSFASINEGGFLW